MFAKNKLTQKSCEWVGYLCRTYFYNTFYLKHVNSWGVTIPRVSISSNNLLLFDKQVQWRELGKSCNGQTGFPKVWDRPAPRVGPAPDTKMVCVVALGSKYQSWTPYSSRVIKYTVLVWHRPSKLRGNKITLNSYQRIKSILIVYK